MLLDYEPWDKKEEKDEQIENQVLRKEIQNQKLISQEKLD